MTDIDSMEFGRQTIFKGLDSEIPLSVQKALYAEHRQAMERQVGALMGLSKDQLFGRLGRELLREEPGYQALEKIALENLKKMFDESETKKAPVFSNDGHVGTIFQAIDAGTVELPEGITPQQTYYVAELLTSLIEPRLSEEFKAGSEVRNLFMRQSLSSVVPSFCKQADLSRAVTVATGLKISKQLVVVAEQAKKILPVSYKYFMGMSVLCRSGAVQVLNEFMTETMAKKPGQTRSDARLKYAK